MASHGDAAKEIWLTEIGCPLSINAPLLDETEQAGLLTQTIQDAGAKLGFSRMHWFALEDFSSPDDTQGYGLFTEDGTARPALSALKTILEKTPASMPRQDAIDVSVIIVNYNTRAVTCDCLASQEQTAPAGLSVEIIVVDDASKDDSSPSIERLYPLVRLIRSPENPWALPAAIIWAFAWRTDVTCRCSTAIPSPPKPCPKPCAA